MAARAVVFEAPHQLALKSLLLSRPGTGDVVVDIVASGISTGTERLLWDGDMPNFPGMGYPLVPGYEAVGRVAEVGDQSDRHVGEFVFVGGAQCFPSIRSLFGGAASRLVVPAEKAVSIDQALGARGLLLALSATAHHALHVNVNEPAIPDLIVGHGVLGRLLARLCIALGYAPPTVWEINASRRSGGDGYQVLAPEQDERRDYRCIVDVSGDSDVLNRTLPRLQRRVDAAAVPEIVLAGFYKAPLTFDFTNAFLREARIQTAAEWTPADLTAVGRLVERGALSLDGLITHCVRADQAEKAYGIAFRDDRCLKMVLDWRNDK